MIARTFALWVLLAACAGFFSDGALSFVLPNIALFLGLVMFGMGMTLRLDQIAPVFARPKMLLVGVSLQFILMPVLAWLLASVLSLPPELAIGFIVLHLLAVQ